MAEQLVYTEQAKVRFLHRPYFYLRRGRAGPIPTWTIFQINIKNLFLVYTTSASSIAASISRCQGKEPRFLDHQPPKEDERKDEVARVRFPARA